MRSEKKRKKEREKYTSKNRERDTEREKNESIGAKSVHFLSGLILLSDTEFKGGVPPFLSE